MEKKSSGKSISIVPIIVVIAVVVFAVTFAIITFTNNSGSKSVADYDGAVKTMEKYYKKIKVGELSQVKGSVDLEAPDLEASLPDIDKYPAQVENTTPDYVEIFSSPEKSTISEGSSDYDRWLVDMAEEFNNAGITVDGKPVSVMMRGMASGMALDYISTGKYVPDAYTPSNSLWGDSMKEMGIKSELLEERLLGNVAGFVLSKKKHQEITDKYGSVTIETITKAVTDNEIAMGYTNPLSSSTGANFLLSMLYTFDNGNPLGDKAVGEFEAFQNNLPFIAYTTLQMKDSAKSGMLDGFVFEYQQYVNSPDIKADYVFTPFGIRHDNPIYGIGKLSKEKKQILEEFIAFCKSDEGQKKASSYGFNGYDDYEFEIDNVTGELLTSAQKIWKEKKNGERDIVAVFVADVSGSMDGEPLNRLKQSLLNGAKYIDNDNYIGLVTYSDNVDIALPIGAFDINQRAYFAGAINNMSASGGTATYDAIIVAEKMLVEASEEHPNAKLMLFVLSDGETNVGHTMKEIDGVVRGLQIPIYTIGYNADLEALQEISRINEAASINADSEDVVYKLQNLFNAEM